MLTNTGLTVNKLRDTKYATFKEIVSNMNIGALLNKEILGILAYQKML